MIFSSKPRKATLILRDQLGIESTLPVARYPQFQLRALAQHRLLRIAVAPVRLARCRLAVQMIVQLRRQNPVRQGLLQLVNKPVLGENSPWVTPCKQLIQCVLLDDHMRPPSASLWPRTQNNGQSHHYPLHSASLFRNLGTLIDREAHFGGQISTINFSSKSGFSERGCRGSGPYPFGLATILVTPTR